MTTDLLYNARIPEDKKLNDKTLQIKKLVDNFKFIKEKFIKEKSPFIK